MLYLIIAILCGASINLGFALAGKKGLDNLNTTLMNYVAACGISAATFASGLRSGELERAFSGRITVPLAIIAGVIYLACLLYIQKALAENGPSATTMFNRLSMVIPVLVSILVFHEHAGIIRWAGIALAIASLVLFNWEGGLKFNRVLMILWVIGGGAELANSLFARLCPAADKPFYMTLVFGTAGLCTCALLLKRRGPKISGKEILLGLAIGCVNLGSASFTVSALQHLPTSLVYPTLTVSIILLTTIAGVLFFGDKLKKQHKAALLLALAAVVILNL
jgi:drug/metabolite transporter (DMT)-like permease